jgi:hypothetical protein
MGVLRPVVNRVRAWRRLPPVPGPGAVMPLGSLVSATVPDERDWAPVLSRVCQVARRRGVEWIALTLDRRDPALPALGRLLRPRVYASTLYDVAWRGRPSWHEAWDARPFRPDAGFL